MTKTKLTLRISLEDGLADRLRAMGVPNRTAIIEDALRAWLSNRASDVPSDRFDMRLNAISSQINRIETSTRILVESLALHIRLTLLRDVNLPEADEAMRSLARARFEQFVTEVGRSLSKGENALAPALTKETN